jgi:SPP1 gp7 family putative phage head morphogenesis protein
MTPKQEAKQRQRRADVAFSRKQAMAGFREAAAEGVAVRLELSTARDDAVCPACAALHGRIFTLEEAERIIPLHEDCRCCWLPVVEAP